MRYLILADLHANLEALAAVLSAVDVHEFDLVLVLGDFVGYGPDPNEVIALIRSLPVPIAAVRGNHDRVASGISSPEGFNEIAARAALWTADRLDAASLEFLHQLAVGPCAVSAGLEICHGSPVDEDDYILCSASAGSAFAATGASVVFFGHSHLPSCFQLGAAGIDLALMTGEGWMHLSDGERYLLNPGSVGQPRDGDPRAAYMTYSSWLRRVDWHRVAYPVAVTAEKVCARGLPEAVATRLLVGE